MSNSRNTAVETHAVPVRRLSLHYVLAVVLFFLGVSVNGTIAMKLERLEVFDQPDVVFHTDVNWRLRCFMWGKGGMGYSLIHPNLCSIVHPAVRVASAGVRYAVPSLATREDSRRFVSLMVGPVASGLAAVILCMLGGVLGMGAAGSALLGMLYLGSYSQLVFGSIPDHFVLGGMAVCAALYLAVMTLKRQSDFLLPWTGLAAFAGSLTITHVALITFVYGICQLHFAGFPKALIRAVTVGGAALVLILTLHLTSGLVTGQPGKTFDTLGNWVSLYSASSPAVKLMQFPSSTASAISAAEVDWIEQPPLPLEWWPEAKRDAQRYDSMFFVNTSILPQTLLTGVLVVIIVWWSTLWWVTLRQKGPRDIEAGFYSCCAAVLAFNGIFHALWGSGYFLYSQFWLAASVCSVVMILKDRRLPRNLAWAAVLCVTAAVYVNNFLQVNEMFAVLEGVPTR